MKKLLAFSLAVLLLVCTLASCGGKGASLEGKWVNAVSGVEIHAFEFTKDEMTYSAAGVVAYTVNYKAEDGKLILTDKDGNEFGTFTYTLEGDTLTVKMTDVGDPIVCKKK